jgi:hypothetical protein
MQDYQLIGSLYPEKNTADSGRTRIGGTHKATLAVAGRLNTNGHGRKNRRRRAEARLQR